jgi:hypothetical protein
MSIYKILGEMPAGVVQLDLMMALDFLFDEFLSASVNHTFL